MHVGDVFHLRLHQLVVSGLVGELQDVQRDAHHRRLRQGVEPGDIRTLVVNLQTLDSCYNLPLTTRPGPEPEPTVNIDWGVTCWRRAASWVLLWCENSMLACMAARERHSSSVKATTIIVPLSPASLTSHQPRGLRERAMTSSPPTQHKTNKALIKHQHKTYFTTNN